MLLLPLLSSLVTQKLFTIEFDITTEQNFRHMELADAKIWISKMHDYVEFLQIGLHFTFQLVDTYYITKQQFE